MKSILLKKINQNKPKKITYPSEIENKWAKDFRARFEKETDNGLVSSFNSCSCLASGSAVSVFRLELVLELNKRFDASSILTLSQDGEIESISYPKIKLVNNKIQTL
tara:strand:- start:387 stop:707 length:321 start_codon:yes stop_codon:yes gene_type:complete